MTDTIIEIVASAGAHPVEITSRDTQIPGQWAMDVCHGGAMVNMRRVRMIAPRTGIPVDCLQVTLDGQIFTVVPDAFKADFVPSKSRGGGPRAPRKKKASTKTVPKEPAPQLEAIAAKIAASRSARRPMDTFAGYRNGADPRADLLPSAPVEPIQAVVGNIQFAPAGTATKEPVKRPIFGVFRHIMGE